MGSLSSARGVSFGTGVETLDAPFVASEIEESDDSGRESPALCSLIPDGESLACSLELPVTPAAATRAPASAVPASAATENALLGLSPAFSPFDCFSHFGEGSRDA